MVQSVKIRLSIQGTWVPSMAGELRCHKTEGSEVCASHLRSPEALEPARLNRRKACAATTERMRSGAGAQQGKDPLDYQPQRKDSACCKEDPPHRVAKKTKFKKLLFK